VDESKWLGGILRSVGFLHAPETSKLQQNLLAATFGGIALESALGHIAETSTLTYGRVRLMPEVSEAFKPGNASRSASIFLDAISSAPSDEIADMFATCHVAFTIMEKSGLFPSKHEDEETEEKTQS